MTSLHEIFSRAHNQRLKLSRAMCVTFPCHRSGLRHNVTGSRLNRGSVPMIGDYIQIHCQFHKKRYAGTSCPGNLLLTNQDDSIY
jgi:hypothetical protein